MLFKYTKRSRSCANAVKAVRATDRHTICCCKSYVTQFCSTYALHIHTRNIAGAGGMGWAYKKLKDPKAALVAGGFSVAYFLAGWVADFSFTR